MKVIKPVSITDAALTSSNVPDTSGNYTAWNPATSYTVGAVVYRATTHHLYTCLVAGVDSTLPETSVTLTSPRWADGGPINRWAMFDGQVSTETVHSTSIAVTLHLGLINAIALVNVSALDVAVSLTYEGQTVYADSRNLDMSEIYDWYDYFFAGFELITQVVFTDLPPYAGANLTVTISGVGAVTCGALIVGNVYDIGEMKYEPSIEILDYSVKQTDEYGTTTFVQRKWAKKLDCALHVENNRLNSIFALVSNLRAIPSVWIPSEDIRMGFMMLFGWYSGFSVTIPYPDHSLCTLQLQGLT